LLDGAQAWNLVFADADAFNVWAEERYRWIKEALEVAVARTRQAEPLAVTI